VPGPPRRCQSPPQGEAGRKSIYFSVRHGFPPNFIPALQGGDAPDSAQGLQEEQEPLAPAPFPEQGKIGFTRQAPSNRAELFVLPEEKKKKNPTPQTAFPERLPKDS